ALVRLAPSLVLHRLEPQGDSGHRKDRYTAPSDDGGPAPAHAVGDETAPPRVKLPEFFPIAQEALEFGDAVHSTAPCSVAVAAACCALCAAGDNETFGRNRHAADRDRAPSRYAVADRSSGIAARAADRRRRPGC